MEGEGLVIKGKQAYNPFCDINMCLFACKACSCDLFTKNELS